MARHHAIVVIGGRHQRRRIAGARLDVVERRVSIQIFERLRIVGRSVFRGPRRTGGELLVAQHVHDTDGRQGDGEQIRPLLHRGADEQAAIRTTHDPERLWRRVAVLNQILR